MSYSLYSLTPEEITTIETLNTSRQNVLMIIMTKKQIITGIEFTGVSADDIQNSAYQAYLNALGGVYNPLKVVLVEDSSLP